MVNVGSTTTVKSLNELVQLLNELLFDMENTYVFRGYTEQKLSIIQKKQGGSLMIWHLFMEEQN